MKKCKNFYMKIIKDSGGYGYELYKDAKCISDEQIALLQAACYPRLKVVEITWYRVRQRLGKKEYRRNGIGKQLFEMLVHMAIEDGYTYIVVQPNSNPYDGDEIVECSKLYNIYWKLGFRFLIGGKKITDGLTFDEAVFKYGIDINVPNNKMVYELG